jgi:DNA-binding LacI/PurR family transcriptional regulator
MALRTSKTEMVASRLRSRIVGGAYPPGSFLPAERALADELGVARNTLRAALEALAEEGIIYHEERRGTLVTTSALHHAPGSLLLVLPPPEVCAPSALSPEATALIGHTLCACSGSNIRFHLQAMPEEGPAELVRMAETVQAAGVLLVECHEPLVLETLQQAALPHVVINQEQDLPGPATRVDFWRIGRRAAEHLLGLGHRRLGVLSGPRDYHLYERMLAGFRGRCAEAEVYLPPAHVVRTKSCSETSRQAALDLLRLPNRPTALFCTRDVRAYGAYLAARDLGLAVPEDLSLIGYDDITWPAEGRQLLTTFPEPTRELGTAAIHMLNTWLQTGNIPEDVVICPDLVIRKSTAWCSENVESG